MEIETAYSAYCLKVAYGKPEQYEHVPFDRMLAMYANCERGDGDMADGHSLFAIRPLLNGNVLAVDHLEQLVDCYANGGAGAALANIILNQPNLTGQQLVRALRNHHTISTEQLERWWGQGQEARTHIISVITHKIRYRDVTSADAVRSWLKAHPGMIDWEACVPHETHYASSLALADQATPSAVIDKIAKDGELSRPLAQELASHPNTPLWWLLANDAPLQLPGPLGPTEILTVAAIAEAGHASLSEALIQAAAILA